MRPNFFYDFKIINYIKKLIYKYYIKLIYNK